MDLALGCRTRSPKARELVSVEQCGKEDSSVSESAPTLVLHGKTVGKGLL